MKKHFPRFTLIGLVILTFVFFTMPVTGQTVNEPATMSWAFDAGTSGQVASYSDTTKKYFNQDYVTVGSNLAIVSNSTVDNTYTLIQPSVQESEASTTDLVAFNILPKADLTFKPDSISFDCMRFGTDGGYVDVAWKSADGTITTIQTTIKPARNSTAVGSPVRIDLSSFTMPSSVGSCALYIYIYSLSAGKQIGIADVQVKGTLSGDISNVLVCNLATTVYPDGAGTVATSPGGAEFNENTEVSLTATRNFGYTFSHWENGVGETLSNDNPYTVKMTADTTIKAVFTTLNTYALNITAEGGGKSYMISASPEGTEVNDTVRYEEGTNVTLTASNNPILTFTNWGTGETSPELSFTMNSEKNITAYFSAKDYIAAWDFYTTGSSGRAADFYSNDDNQSSSLVLRNADGTTASWLDKSQLAAGGYEGEPAAVNWKALTDKYYYQLSFNATDFTDISIRSSLLYNYNAYSIQRIEYSLDGTNFTKLDSITMSSAKTWYEKTVTLPDSADHASKVYIRWIPNYNSTVVGTTSTNDGTAISGIYIFGTEETNDLVAPILVSSIPVENGTGASATGKIVLTFDKKVQIESGATATLGTKTLSPTVSGKTITCSYSGLDYNSSYTFTLQGNSVSNLSGVAKTGDIVIHFTTMTRPTVTKRTFDFVVGVDGDFSAALAAASTASSSGNRFYIFFPNGQYNIGENTGDANQMTTITTPKLSIIGQNNDSTILSNLPTTEGISVTATIAFSSAVSNVYMQDLSLKNTYPYGNTTGRAVALWDKGDKGIYKNVKLLSYQDTYYSGSTIRSYFEDCEIHGVVDFICGGGDIFFNECLLYLEDRSDNCISAPATSTDWGYVFSNCTIDGASVNNNSYRLGRPWSNSPKAVYLNTTMIQLPTAAAWGDPMNVVPAVFAEYNSMTSTGSVVDLSNRRTSYTKDETTVVLNPVLSDSAAATYTVENVLGGTDNWQPQYYTDQAAAPVITGNGQTINWDNNDYVLCWGVFKDNVFVQFVTTNSYSIPSDVASGTYTVRAANEMGGLSPVSNTYEYTSSGIINTTGDASILSTSYYTLEGKKLKSIGNYKGVVLACSIYSNGKIETKKVISKGF